MRPLTMLNKLKKTIETYGMINSGDKVLVCVSGGADSMCLLSLLESVKDYYIFSIEVAHVNHMIRGAEADSDEQYVVEYCKNKSIPIHILRINIPELALKTGKSEELIAREERYRYFDSLHCDKIATAHTKSDCVETMLMNLARGCGLHGLTSIPPVRDNIIRPVIDFSRADTEQWCKDNSIKYVTDSTNLEANCTRNKFRLNVITEIKKAVPSFENNASRCMELLKSDDEYLCGVADKLFTDAYNPETNSLNTAVLNGVHNSISTRVIGKYLSLQKTCWPEMKHILALADNINNGYTITVPGGIDIVCDSGSISVKPIGAQCESENIIISKSEIREFSFNSIRYYCYICKKESYKAADNELSFDADLIDENITVRNRRPGDSVIPAKRNCRKTLKKLINECKIPAKERFKLAIFEDTSGIFAIPGVVTDSRCFTNNSENLYIIRYWSDKNDK